MIKKLLILLLLFSNLYAQDANYYKYWSYRARLKQFVKVGDKTGESFVASIRNKNNSTVLNFGGDGTVVLGWYIGVLATEYKILQSQSKNTSATLKDLYYAIKQFERLDNCETRKPWNKQEKKRDGFFMRVENINNNFVVGNTEYFNTKFGLSKVDIFNPKNLGVPTYVDRVVASTESAMSQDQAIHLLMGFRLVYEMLPDTEISFPDNDSKTILYNFNKAAVENTHLIVSYIENANKQAGKKCWVIYNPNGERVFGGNSTLYSYGFASSAKAITKQEYTYKNKNLWRSVVKISSPNEWVNRMSLLLANMGNVWSEKQIYKMSKIHNWETFDLLFWAAIHNKEYPSLLDKNKLKQQLNSAPTQGMYYYGKEYSMPRKGWRSGNKFRDTKEQQNEGRENYKGNYNGLDYMLLYNLSKLVK